MVKTRHPMVLSFDDQKKVEATLPNGHVIFNGKKLSIKDTNGDTRGVKATYGIMRVMYEVDQSEEQDELLSKKNQSRNGRLGYLAFSRSIPRTVRSTKYTSL